MIAKEDIDHLKEIFVTRQECDNTVEEINRKLADDSTALALIEQKLSSLMWISKTILGAVLVAIVGAVMTLIIK